MMTDPPGRAPAESRELCRRVPGRVPVIDPGWVVTLADPARPGARRNLIGRHEPACVPPAASFGVDRMDAPYTASPPATPGGDGSVVNVPSRR